MRSNLVLVAVGFFAAVTHAEWGYEGKHGPAHWGDLSPRYSECSLGHKQSPIDIRDATPADLPPLEVRYGPVPLRIVNDGHTIRVDAPPGSSIDLGGHRYQLVQFHFHAPSEEAIDGKRHALVMHLVHKDADEKTAVVAVLFDVSPERNHALEAVFDNLPQKPGQTVARRGDSIHLDELLPPTRGYYEFEGSLTTPPCKEGVRWLVLKKPLDLSAEQLAAFRSLYPANARPLQPTGHRRIRESLR